MQALDEVFSWGSWKKTKNEFIREQNISDKPIHPFPKQRVATVNCGCGEKWVLKNGQAQNINHRRRGAEAPNQQSMIEEPARLKHCSQLINEAHASGIDVVLIQEGPSNKYTQKHNGLKMPEQDDSRLIKNEEDEEEKSQICNYISLAQGVKPTSSPKGTDIRIQAQALGISPKEFQIVEFLGRDGKHVICINLHFNWSEMYTGDPSKPSHNPKDGFNSRRSFLLYLNALANTVGGDPIVFFGGDLNIEISDGPALMSIIGSGILYQEEGCSTLSGICGTGISQGLNIVSLAEQLDQSYVDLPCSMPATPIEEQNKDEARAAEIPHSPQASSLAFFAPINEEKQLINEIPPAHRALKQMATALLIYKPTGQVKEVKKGFSWTRLGWELGIGYDPDQKRNARDHLYNAIHVFLGTLNPSQTQYELTEKEIKALSQKGKALEELISPFLHSAKLDPRLSDVADVETFCQALNKANLSQQPILNLVPSSTN